MVQFLLIPLLFLVTLLGVLSRGVAAAAPGAPLPNLTPDADYVAASLLLDKINTTDTCLQQELCLDGLGTRTGPFTLMIPTHNSTQYKYAVS